MTNTYTAPYREPEDHALRWIIIFVVVSLLFHAILITLIVLIAAFTPPVKFPVDDKKDSKVTLSLIAPPTPPPQKRIFIPTQPQQNVTPKLQPIESSNDTALQSQSKTPRDAMALMPDVQGKEHAPDMRNSPEVKAPQKPQVSTTLPQPKQSTQQPSPPTPRPQTNPQLLPHPLPPQPKPAPPRPPQPQQPLVDPDTGLPVLPPINAQTLAPPDQAKPLTPVPSQQQIAGSVHGALGRSGDNSPAAMATELGKYKQYVYSVVGSYWYPEIDKHFGLLGVGQVHIQFTIHSDGTLTDVAVLEGDDRDQLKTISKNALVAPAPFKPFSPAMIKEVGDSYTDDFTFSVY
jgi:outer membrane biosynthesis protein TonB